MAKLTIEEINTRLAPKGILLVGGYVNQRTKTTFKCSSGHIWESTTHTIFHSNKGCGKCAGNSKLTHQEVENYLNSLGIKMKAAYKNARTPLQLECPNGHSWSSRLDNIRSGKGCPICADIWPDDGYLYVMGSSKGTKIGVSSSPNKRLKEVSRASGFSDLSLAYLVKLDRATALDLERESHSKFSRDNLKYTGFDGSTEFFQVSPDQVKLFLIEEFGVEVYNVS